MVHAYRRSPAWRAALLHKSYYVFDEHWGNFGPSMQTVYHDMLLAGQLQARPTRRLLIQDTVYVPDQRKWGHYPTIASFGAVASFTWSRSARGGTLLAERRGPCVCSAQVWDNVDIASCSLCLRKPGRIHAKVTVHRRLEVLGFHFQVWKSLWRSTDGEQVAAHVPRSCAGGSANLSRFEVDYERGFRC
eukprot:1823432-Prymnesium_polylepis.1